MTVLGEKRVCITLMKDSHLEAILSFIITLLLGINADESAVWRNDDNQGKKNPHTHKSKV